MEEDKNLAIRSNAMKESNLSKLDPILEDDQTISKPETLMDDDQNIPTPETLVNDEQNIPQEESIKDNDQNIPRLNTIMEDNQNIPLETVIKDDQNVPKLESILDDLLKIAKSDEEQAAELNSVTITEEEQHFFFPMPITSSLEPISLCKCLLDQDDVSQEIFVPERKKEILSRAARTEYYLRERQIPDLIRFIMTKLLSNFIDEPLRRETKKGKYGCDPRVYLERLLYDCMLFRAGHGSPPVLYEQRHLEAVVKSFDPGQRGWLTAGQVRRAFNLLDLPAEMELEERIPTDKVLNDLKQAQECSLLRLLRAGSNDNNNILDDSSLTSI